MPAWMLDALAVINCYHGRQAIRSGEKARHEVLLALLERVQ